MSSSKEINIQLYEMKRKEFVEFDVCEDPDRLLVGIGRVVTVYENCEASIHSLLRPLGKDPNFTSFVFQSINSRQNRFQMLEPILAQKATGTKAKTLAALSRIIESARLLGQERDAVAHSLLMLVSLPDSGKESYVLAPPNYIERKYIGGVPKHFYDITRLEKLTDKLTELNHELTLMIHARGERYTRRLMQRARPAVQSDE